LRIDGRTSPYNQSWNGSALKAFDQLIKRYRLDSLMTVTSCGRPMLSMVYRFDIPSVLQCRVTACGAFTYPNMRQTSMATNHNVPSGSTNTRIFWFVAGNTTVGPSVHTCEPRCQPPLLHADIANAEPTSKHRKSSDRSIIFQLRTDGQSHSDATQTAGDPHQ
jgi:hypothetical protein